jgi:tRNA threonylcarbamoyladenosine modification (KEOPS) complex Cgi121 subunit
MMEEIDNQCLLTLGFSNPRISDPEKTLDQLRSARTNVQVQLLKADLVAGPEHLRFAARNALRSFKGKSPRSKSLAVEYLLYISCQRQISKAISLLGVQPKDDRVLLVGLSESKEALQELEKESKSMMGDSSDRLVDIGSKRKLTAIRHAYDISTREMNATRFEGESDEQVVKRLIVERSALLNLED